WTIRGTSDTSGSKMSQPASDESRNPVMRRLPPLLAARASPHRFRTGIHPASTPPNAGIGRSCRSGPAEGASHRCPPTDREATCPAAEDTASRSADLRAQRPSHTRTRLIASRSTDSRPCHRTATVSRATEVTSVAERASAPRDVVVPVGSGEASVPEQPPNTYELKCQQYRRVPSSPSAELRRPPRKDLATSRSVEPMEAPSDVHTVDGQGDPVGLSEPLSPGDVGHVGGDHPPVHVQHGGGDPRSEERR